MARLQQTKVKEMDQKFLSVIFDPKLSREDLAEKEKSKIDLFEKGLAGELSKTDTIEKSVEKMVRMALAAEFGASLVTKPGAKNMINTISRGILCDSELRRSALIIADRFAGSNRGTEIKLRGKKILNG